MVTDGAAADDAAADNESAEQFVDWDSVTLPTPGPQSNPPPPQALAWVESKLQDQIVDCRIVDVEELQGGMSSAVHRLRFERSQQRAVLRRYAQTAWIEREPHIPHDEARTLELLGQLDVGVATPALIAADPDGQHCDVPAVLMTEVPGAPDIHPGSPASPTDPDDWAIKLAECLAGIHQVAIPEGLASSQRWDSPGRPLPTWTTAPELWRQAISKAAGPLPEQPATFLHRDFHPNNVHWSEGEICGVVDWLGACVGPAAVDVAHCRWNLAMLVGPQTAELFTEQYRSVTGHNHELLAYDLSTVLSGPVGPFPTFAWNSLGRHDLTSESVATKIDDWLRWLLADGN